MYHVLLGTVLGNESVSGVPEPFIVISIPESLSVGE
jgi:hypothetical protein